VWTAVAASVSFGLLATLAASRGRWQDARVWSAFAAGGVVFLVTRGVARPVGGLLGTVAGGTPDVPAWPVVAVLAVFAEVSKLTAALVVHQLYRMEAWEGGWLGAAVGAGFGAWSEAVILRSVFQVAQLGLPGGVSLASALTASAARLLAGAGSTGLAARLATSGRTGVGLAVACAVQLSLDPALRVVAPSPRWALAATAVVGTAAFAALWLPGERGEG
jgi:hypothetical protein